MGRSSSQGRTAPDGSGKCRMGDRGFIQGGTGLGGLVGVSLGGEKLSTDALV